MSIASQEARVSRRVSAWFSLPHPSWGLAESVSGDLSSSYLIRVNHDSG